MGEYLFFIHVCVQVILQTAILLLSHRDDIVTATGMSKYVRNCPQFGEFYKRVFLSFRVQWGEILKCGDYVSRQNIKISWETCVLTQNTEKLVSFFQNKNIAVHFPPSNGCNSFMYSIAYWMSVLGQPKPQHFLQLGSNWHRASI